MVLCSACVIRLATVVASSVSQYRVLNFKEVMFCQFSRPVFSILLKIGELKTGI